MQQYLDVIQQSILFDGLKRSEIESMLSCLQATIKTFTKNEPVLHAGETVSSIGMLLSGDAYILQEDFWGNRNIVSPVTKGQLFAEAFACTPGARLTVSVIAGTHATVMFFNVQRVLTTCSASCGFHCRIIRNLLADLAGKNLLFNEKITHMAQRATRDKLLSYLSSEALRQNSAAFDIPYNRQQLADYLSVERSAMSRELCKMREDGILSFQKNHFCLKNFTGLF
ncbi:MAG: Crp/Fnr family transcriptional regulator [Clostridiales bacterium]|jgi:CRP-like cAMP-binding protein|nr:Crp/Fnr family transcriptional regulator [Clostridiales bacterium]